MKLKVRLSIGYPTAMHHDTIEIDDEDMEGMDVLEKERYIEEQVSEWAHEYIEYWWEESK